MFKYHEAKEMKKFLDTVTDCKTKEDQQMLDQIKHYLDWPLQLYALQEAEFQLRSCLEEKEQALITKDVICQLAEELYEGPMEDGEEFDQVTKKFLDINDEMRLWIPLMGENGVPNDAEALLEDAKWKKQALLELSDALEKASDNLPILSVKEFAEILAFSIEEGRTPDYDFAIKSKESERTWYGIKKLNTGFNSSCVDLYTDYYGGGKGVYHKIDTDMDEEEKGNIIQTMILSVLEDEVADADTLLVVQKLS